jgi:hypothetical protein
LNGKERVPKNHSFFLAQGGWIPGSALLQLAKCRYQMLGLYHREIEVLFYRSTVVFFLSLSESVGSPQVSEVIRAHTISELSK